MLASARIRAMTPPLYTPLPLSWPAICSDSRAFQEEFPVRDFPAGYGPSSTAAIGAKPPTITTLRYTSPAATDASSSRVSRDNSAGEDNKELLLCGCDDGAVTVRPALAAGVYARIQAHNGDAAVAAAACSCDGEWIVSGDSDGMLAVHRLRREPFEVRSGTRGRMEPLFLGWFCPRSVIFHVECMLAAAEAVNHVQAEALQWYALQQRSAS